MTGIAGHTMTLAAADPFGAAITSPTTIWLAILTLAGLTVMVFGLRASIRLRRAAPAKASILRDESGTAMFEFLLLLPVLLMLALLITQSTLAMGANVFVHYSAFASARTAIVQIPAAYSDDEPNILTPSKGSTKYDAIQQAACMALLPIGGEGEGGGEYNAQAVASGLTKFYSDYGSAEPPWISNLVVNRLNYVSQHTVVNLYKAHLVGDTGIELEPVDTQFEFEPKDAVTAEVVHGFHLSVPYAAWFFSDSKLEDSSDVGGTERTMTLRASATLNLEGILDEMPPEPRLPRLP